MTISCFEIIGSSRLELFPTGEFDARIKGKTAGIWLDLQKSADSDIEYWLEKLGAGEATRRVCLESAEQAGFYPLKGEGVIVIPLEGDRSEIQFVTFVLTRDVLLTIHREQVWSSEQISRLQESTDWLPARTVAGLLSALIVGHSLGSLWKASGLRSTIKELENQMDKEPETVEPEDIMRVRGQVLTLEEVVADQLLPVTALTKTGIPQLHDGAVHEFLQTALNNLKAADKSIDRLEARVAALRSGFEMHAQDKTNRRLNVLTILSAIFLPMTFLAGIWGMNFVNMPELEYGFSYPIALGLMTFIAFGMYHFFRKHGWFD